MMRRAGLQILTRNLPYPKKRCQIFFQKWCQVYFLENKPDTFSGRRLVCSHIALATLLLSGGVPAAEEITYAKHVAPIIRLALDGIRAK